MSSVFSGSSGRQAALWSAQQAELTRLLTEARIQQGQTSALDAIEAGRSGALDAVGTGYDDARTAYGQASALYQPYVDAGRRASTTYNAAIGLGTPEEATAARAAFTASPNYQWDVDQATDAVLRKASATGSLGSGNTSAAIASTAERLANQEYGGWLDRVNGVGQQGYAATGAQAGLQRGIGDLSAAQGGAEAGIHTGAGAAQAGVYNQGTAQSVGAITGAGSQTMSAGQQGMLAGQQAGVNQLNAWLNGAKLVTDVGSRAMFGGVPTSAPSKPGEAGSATQPATNAFTNWLKGFG